jgi:diadenosine tetraphosphate (Ap4A) HIT family hydrolase
LRPGQVTLGALVLICKEPSTAFSLLSIDAFTELQSITTHIEDTLKNTFDYDKINYLMLMMVDPDVHFHVLPRYQDSRRFSDQEFIDQSWPAPQSRTTQSHKPGNQPFDPCGTEG